MPTFDTPEPISVSLELGVGDVRIEATDRTDTVVEVRPSDPDEERRRDGRRADARRVRERSPSDQGPEGWRRWRSREARVDRRLDRLADRIARARGGRRRDRAVDGRLGEFRCKAGVGDIQLDETGPWSSRPVSATSRSNALPASAEVVTGSGSVRIGRVDGAAVVKNSNGDTWIGEVAGEARVNAANGDITIDLAHEGVAAKSANGDVRLGEVARGAAVAQTAAGALEIGVRDGVAAWLDLHTGFGNVVNDLEASGAPDRGKTRWRSTPAPPTATSRSIAPRRAERLVVLGDMLDEDERTSGEPVERRSRWTGTICGTTRTTARSSRQRSCGRTIRSPPTFTERPPRRRSRPGPR